MEWRAAPVQHALLVVASAFCSHAHKTSRWSRGHVAPPETAGSACCGRLVRKPQGAGSAASVRSALSPGASLPRSAFRHPFCGSDVRDVLSYQAKAWARGAPWPVSLKLLLPRTTLASPSSLHPGPRTHRRHRTQRAPQRAQSAQAALPQRTTRHSSLLAHARTAHDTATHDTHTTHTVHSHATPDQTETPKTKTPQAARVAQRSWCADGPPHAPRVRRPPPP